MTKQKFPNLPSLPPPFDQIGRQIAIGLGKVATRAMASGAKSVTQDVKRLGKTMQQAAERTGAHIDKIINGDDQDTDDEHTR